MDQPRAAVDEGRHPPGPRHDWEESWSFDFASADGELAGLARLALVPAAGRAWWWAYVARRGERLLVVRDHEVRLPRPPSLEIRAEGLWAEVSCLIPHVHWTIGLEAFAVALDDPEDALAGERGERIGLGFDLEWEGVGPLAPVDGGYGQSCLVHGDILIGGGPTPVTVALDGTGTRWHQWGDAPALLPPLAPPAPAPLATAVIPLDPPRTGVLRHPLPSRAQF